MDKRSAIRSCAATLTPHVLTTIITVFKICQVKKVCLRHKFQNKVKHVTKWKIYKKLTIFSKQFVRTNEFNYFVFDLKQIFPTNLLQKITKLRY